MNCSGLEMARSTCARAGKDTDLPVQIARGIESLREHFLIVSLHYGTNCKWKHRVRLWSERPTRRTRRLEGAKQVNRQRERWPELLIVRETSRRSGRFLAEHLSLTSCVSRWILQPIWILSSKPSPKMSRPAFVAAHSGSLNS